MSSSTSGTMRSRACRTRRTGRSSNPRMRPSCLRTWPTTTIGTSSSAILRASSRAFTSSTAAGSSSCRRGSGSPHFCRWIGRPRSRRPRRRRTVRSTPCGASSAPRTESGSSTPPSSRPGSLLSSATPPRRPMVGSHWAEARRRCGTPLWASSFPSMPCSGSWRGCSCAAPRCGRAPAASPCSPTPSSPSVASPLWRHTRWCATWPSPARRAGCRPRSTRTSSSAASVCSSSSSSRRLGVTTSCGPLPARHSTSGTFGTCSGSL
mmetsp:Transcript_116966/g.338094  ORF Transcript_116966/g.338094 Transcript_116966/m.338094 type:complete len:264 (-) Transcript_116966:956-1747(-)